MSIAVSPCKSTVLDPISAVFLVCPVWEDNATARVVTRKPLHLSLVDTLHELHWLPVQWHIKIKLVSCTSKLMHIETPPYLFCLRILTILLRFLDYLLLLTSYKFLASVLPLTVQLLQLFRTDLLHSSSTFNSFWHHLKAHLFQAAFNAPSSILWHLRFTYVINCTL